MSKDDNITPEEWIYSALSPLDHKHVPLLKLVLNGKSRIGDLCE